MSVNSDLPLAENKTAWFASWFDSPYYHILYKDRNHEDAAIFMDNLTSYLNLPENGKILDLACGKGRHSIYLNTLGYDVMGIDLSSNSIAEAKKFTNNTLHFDVHDMRLPYQGTFDAVFNLFTSFGYFDCNKDHISTLQSIRQNLNETGFGVIDFMNVDHVIENLVENEVKTVDNIDFHIHRKVENQSIVKQISFEDQGKLYTFEERVKCLRLADFEDMITKSDMYLLEIFGDYKLRKFQKNQSERLILLFK
jgi:SAM-dependent methyltransferase